MCIPDPKLAAILQHPQDFPECAFFDLVRHVHATEKRRRMIKSLALIGQCDCICNHPTSAWGFGPCLVDFRYISVNGNNPGSTNLSDYPLTAAANIDHAPLGSFLNHNALLGLGQCIEYHMDH